MPVQPQPAEALAPETTARPAAVVLIVDDEPAIRNLVRTNLEHVGLRVVEAADGVAGLEAVQTENPDLVILDVMMPLIDGFEMLKRLRQDTRTNTLPVIMLTAKARDADIFHGWLTGADSYLTKPFSPLELISLVKRVLATSNHPDRPA